MPLVRTKNGHQWSWSVEGEGQPLLFIHGWSADSRIWLGQQRYFAQNFRVAVVDLPGHGQTRWQDLELEAIAQELNEILEKEKFSPAALVGSSFGGLVSLKMYELFPAVARSLVFVGSQPKFLASAEYPWGLAPARIEKLQKQLVSDYPAIVPIFFRSLFTPKERAGERFRWLQSFRKTEEVPDQAALLRLLEVLIAADLRAVLKSVTVPLQFIYGTEDSICPAELYAQLKKELLRGQFCAMAGCGHFPFVSHPFEFNQLLENFLKSHG